MDVVEVRVVETLPSSALVTYNAALATVSSNLRAKKGVKKPAADIARKQQAAVATYNTALISPPIVRGPAVFTPTSSRKRKLPAMPNMPEVTLMFCDNVSSQLTFTTRRVHHFHRSKLMPT